MDLLNTLQRFPTIPLRVPNPNSIGSYSTWPLPKPPTSPFPLPPHDAVHIKAMSFSLANVPSSLNKLILRSRITLFTLSERLSLRAPSVFLHSTFIVFMFEATWFKSLVQRSCKLQEGRSQVRSVPHISGLLAWAWFLGSALSVCTKWMMILVKAFHLCPHHISQCPHL